MFLLLTNVKSTKERYNVENFKEYFLHRLSQRIKNDDCDIIQELSENLLRTRESIRQKLYNIYKNGTVNSSETYKPFSKEEEEKLLKLHTKYPGNWDLISDKMNRSIRCLKSKYQYIQRANISNSQSAGTRRSFTKEEDESLLALVDEYRENGIFGKNGNIPWTLLARKLGNRVPRIYQQRFNQLTSVKMDAPTRYKAIMDVLRLIVDQGVQDISDVDWEKVRKSIGYQGLASSLSAEFSRFMSRNLVDKNLSYKEILKKLSSTSKYCFD